MHRQARGARSACHCHEGCSQGTFEQMTQTIILRGQAQRDLAKRIIDAAGPDFVVTVSAPKRSTDQNAKMHAMLADISRSKPEGRHWTPDTWKAALMHSCGHQCQFAEGLDGSGPFPIGFRSSRLTKPQMSDLITVIIEYGDRHGVEWSNEWRPDHA